jgi:membrane fusion protein (multidrug efflux system)
VSVGDYVKEGQELVNIEDIGTLKIDFRLPESYLAQLKPGQQLEVSSDALPGQLFTAVLDAINPLVEAGGRAIACAPVCRTAKDACAPACSCACA